MPQTQIFLAQVQDMSLAADYVTLSLVTLSGTHIIQCTSAGDAQQWEAWLQHGIVLRKKSVAAAAVLATPMGAALAGIGNLDARSLVLENQPFYIGPVERPVSVGVGE